MMGLMQTGKTVNPAALVRKLQQWPQFAVELPLVLKPTLLH
jgi:hypothetical protein